MCHWSLCFIDGVMLAALVTSLTINALVLLDLLSLIPEVSLTFSYVRICLSITDNANEKIQLALSGYLFCGQPMLMRFNKDQIGLHS
mgnify:CR=1 FL=1